MSLAWRYDEVLRLKVLSICVWLSILAMCEDSARKRECFGTVNIANRVPDVVRLLIRQIVCDQVTGYLIDQQI